MSESPQGLAAEFMREVRLRRRDRTLNRGRWLAFGLIVLMVGASFIEAQDVRRWVGLGLLGLLLAVKGYGTWRQWAD